MVFNVSYLSYLVNTDKVWDDTANLDKIAEQWPNIRLISISQAIVKITKKKCEQASKHINGKQNRFKNNKMHVSNY